MSRIARRGVATTLFLLLAFPLSAEARILVRNRDHRAHGIRIFHVVGRTSTEIPRHGLLLIDGSEEATAIQLEDAHGEPLGAKVAIEDGDHITITRGEIVRTPEGGAAKN